MAIRNTPTTGVGTIRAASFDLWGTLIKSDPAFKPARNTALAEIYDLTLPARDFTRILARHDRAADGRAMDTGVDYDFTARVLPALAEAGATAKALADTARAEHAYVTQAEIARKHPPVPFVPQVPAAMARLAQRMPLAITSNTGMLHGQLMREMLDLSGLLEPFTVHTFSNEVAASKPTAAIFQATYAGLADQLPCLAMTEIVHIGDNAYADVIGARNSWMRGVLVNAGGTVRPVLSTIDTLTEKGTLA